MMVREVQLSFLTKEEENKELFRLIPKMMKILKANRLLDRDS